MKKSNLAVALTLALGTVAAQAGQVNWNGTFTMYDPAGTQMDANDGAPGMVADVTGTLDTVAGTFSLASTNTFFGLLWSTSGGTLLGGGAPGVYSHSTVDPAPAVSGGTYTGITVGLGQTGGTVDFAWGGTTGIDVVMVWDGTGSAAGTTYTSTDWDGNGWAGAGMIDGPFPGFSANFNMTVPVPAAVWLFGSGLLGLVGVARRSKKA